MRAWQEPGGDEVGLVVVDDEMIEALHLDVARRILRNRSRSKR